MNVIVDTNVFASGIFFTGAPHLILSAWRDGRVTLVVSMEIMAEYRRVVRTLARQFPAIDPDPPLALVAIHARLVEAPPLPSQRCTDPDDDKFLAAAVASNTLVVTTGDKALLRTSGYRGIEVMTPRAFVEKYLPC